MEELRASLSEGVESLVKANPQDFFHTAELVVANLDRMLAEHERQIGEIKSKMAKFGFKDVGSWLAIESIKVAAAATGTPLYGLVALLGNQLLDVPKLRDLPARIRALVEESKKVRRSPVGLLLQPRTR
jgi:hypothetical protein